MYLLYLPLPRHSLTNFWVGCDLHGDILVESNSVPHAITVCFFTPMTKDRYQEPKAQNLPHKPRYKILKIQLKEINWVGSKKPNGNIWSVVLRLVWTTWVFFIWTERNGENLQLIFYSSRWLMQLDLSV